jgi:undecaprenyl-diphosphatase
MNLIYLKALILGIIEGLTEFIPVSSTGHLIIFADILNFNSIPEKVFEISIQTGAILAICIIYRKKLTNVALNFYHDTNSQNFIINLLIAFTPSVIIGLMLHSFITKHLFSSTIVAISLIIGGIIMIIFDRLKIERTCEDIDKVTRSTALKIGLFQLISMIPGVSRSGSTILGGVYCGLSRKTAAEFSFFLALPTILGATVLDLYKNYHLISVEHISLIFVGFVAAFISGIIVVIKLIEFIQKFGFTPFGYYRIILGTVILAFSYL